MPRRKPRPRPPPPPPHPQQQQRPQPQRPEVFKTIHYRGPNGRSLVGDWLRKIPDAVAHKAVARRLRRMEDGNFGDCRPVRAGVWELRVDVGPGYRVYYAKDGLAVVLLLCGGDKRTQSSDIDRAVSYWLDWQTKEETS